MLHRREFLSLAGAALTARSAQGSVADPVAEYDRQGFHRTGTAVDRASAEWLAGLVRERGLAPQLERFRVSRIDPQLCFVESGARRVEGLPFFDGSFTDVGGLRGRVGPLGSDAPIGWVESAPNVEGGELFEARNSGRHHAIVVVTRGGSPGLSVTNAPNFTRPLGPPVVQIPSQESAWLRDLSASRGEVLVVARVRRVEADALNVTAVRKGKDRSLQPVAIMTPRSGWWHCASERGGGIVCWLEAISAIRQPARDVHFIASSGHELGYLGLEAFLEKNRSLVKSARAWIHFGANIGAATGQGATLQSSDDYMESLAMGELARLGLNAARRPHDRIPNGEAGSIHRGGGRYVSLLAGNDLFHNSLDRWPAAVNPAALEKFAAAFVAVAMKLAQRG